MRTSTKGVKRTNEEEKKHNAKMQTKNLQIYSQYNNLTKRQKHERTERVFFLIDHFLKIMKLQKG